MRNCIVSRIVLICLVLSFAYVKPVDATVVEWGYCDAFDQNKVKWVLEDNGTLTISGNGYMESYSYDGGVPPWGKNRVSRVVIEDGILNVSSGSFSDQKKLVSIMIASSVSRIDSFAFDGSEQLQSANIPDEVETIGTCSFAGCKNLESVKLSNNLKTIKYQAFQGCEKLTCAEIPDGCKSIEAFAFCRCPKLRYVVIPASVTDIDDDAFTSSDPVIYCSPGSAAYTYAVDHYRKYDFGKIAQIISSIISQTKTYGCAAFSLKASAKTKLTYSSNNTTVATVSSDGKVTVKNPGTAKITIKAAENDKFTSATKTITITVKLKKPTLSGKALGGKKAKLTWSKVPGRTKYQVYYYQPSKGKYVLVSSRTMNTIKLKVGKKGKAKFKVRAYRTVSGKKVYSSYSAVKAIKIK